MLTQFTKRWFVLDVNRFVFGYSRSRGKELKKAVPIREIIDVFRFERIEPQIKDWIFEFHVETTDRTYVLFAKSEGDCFRWLVSFKKILQMRG